MWKETRSLTGLYRPPPMKVTFLTEAQGDFLKVILSDLLCDVYDNTEKERERYFERLGFSMATFEKEEDGPTTGDVKVLLSFED